MANYKILWITADCFIDVDRQLVPYLREHSDYEIRWLVLQSLNGAKVSEHKDYEIFNLLYRGKDIRTFFQVSRFLNQIKANQFDLIYSDALGLMYYTALLHAKGKTPLVHAAHNVNPYPVWPIGLRMEVKNIFRRCKNFQMFSKHTTEWFKLHYPNKSFFYAPMVVKDFGKVQTDNYKVNEKKVNLLFFGNVVANKRLDLLIDAVKELPENIQNKVHLNICGNCRMNKEAFLQQIGDCKCISTYFKRIPDEEIPELFTKHQFFMLPYQDVAQSGPHMIAYNYNLPVIASDIDGFAERVEDGENGFLFRVKDKESLKTAITKAAMMSTSAYQRMKDKLKAYVEENNSLKAVSNMYIDYFNSILN